MGISNFATPDDPSSSGPPPTGNAPNVISLSPKKGDTADAEDMLIDYNAKFATAGTTMFRDAIVEQTIAVLVSKDKPNALLVGPAGCGKTRIVEDIAYRLATNDPLLPDTLKHHTVWELPLSNIVAGSCYVGDVEGKLKSVIDFAADPANKAILFIDEAHLLMSDSQTYSKIAQILKPALARGGIKVIAATTTQEAKDFDSDPAFKRRFTRLLVDELTPEQTVEVLRDAKAKYEQFHNFQVCVDADMLPALVATADAYGSAGNHRPDSALTLLDRSIAEAIVARKSMEKKAQNDPVLLAALHASPGIVVTEAMMRKTALRIATGQATPPDFDETTIREAMSRIKGQDDIIETLISMLRRRDLGLFPKTTPDAYIFAGPSGVGKTEVTKILSRHLFNEEPLILNMTEYHSPSSINRIIGAPAGYVGSDSKAELPFDCLATNPYKVVLLDEFEKADRAVQRLFMSALDEGHLKTNQGSDIDFSKTIIIATTNAGHSYGASSSNIGFMGREASSKRADMVTTLSSWFDTELINRFDDVLTFNEIDRDTYAEIVSATYAREVARIKEDKPYLNLADEIPDNALHDIVAESYVAKLGARPVNHAVSKYIESEVYAQYAPVATP